MKVNVMTFLNQSILQLYQTYKYFLGKGSGSINESVIDYNIITSNYNPLYQITKIIRLSKKSLINTQNIDDYECFKWYFVRFLHSADCKFARITKPDKDLAKTLDFKDIKFPVKIRDIYNIEKIILLP